ncbi:hypothetical protein, partial [Staphylococcus aureus]
MNCSLRRFERVVLGNESSCIDDLQLTDAALFLITKFAEEFHARSRSAEAIHMTHHEQDFSDI